MKLVLKNKQEIEIASMNSAYAFENFRDGKGNELNYNSIITLFTGKNESFDSVKAKLADGNNTGFVLSYGNNKRDFTGWKVESITEDLTDNSETIAIKLGKL